MQSKKAKVNEQVMMRIDGILGNFISSSCSKGRGRGTNNRFAPLLTPSHTLMWMRMAVKKTWTPTPTARLEKRLSDSLRFARWDPTFWRVNGALCIDPWGVIHWGHKVLVWALQTLRRKEWQSWAQLIHLRIRRRVRDTLKQSVNTDEGSVPWQWIH